LVTILAFLPALATLALAQPPLVAVRPADARCPSAVEVEAALLARLPGVVVAFDRAAERRALQLGLITNPDKTSAELTLADAEGRVRLRRSLSGADERRDCGALAETAALMVERYLVELDERALAAARGPTDSSSITPLIAAADPEPTWTLAVGSAVVVGPLGGEGFDLGVRASRLLGHTGDLLGTVRVGVGPAFDPIPADAGYDGRAQVRRFPVEVGASWQGLLGRGTLDAGAGLGLDIHRVEVTAVRGAGISETLLAPTIFAEAGWRFAITRQLFLRLGVAALAHWLRYDFSRSELMQSNGPDSSDAVFSLPAHRIQARLTAEIGLSLPLMKSWSTRP
jgi:hypothetical protein